MFDRKFVLPKRVSNKIGRNEKVLIAKGDESKVIKYKKAKLEESNFMYCDDKIVVELKNNNLKYNITNHYFKQTTICVIPLINSILIFYFSFDFFLLSIIK